MARFISGLFPNRAEAERAVDALEDLGYAQDDISVVMQPATRERDSRAPDLERTGAEDVHVAADVGVGAGFGGTLGAIIAGVTATGAIVATGGVAAPIVAGPLAAILAGAGAGGIAGGIIGALTSVGVPKNRLEEYETGLERGAILVGVNAREADEAVVRRILIDRDYSAATANLAGSTSRTYVATRGGEYRAPETPGDYPTMGGDLPRGGDLPTRQA